MTERTIGKAIYVPLAAVPLFIGGCSGVASPTSLTASTASSACSAPAPDMQAAYNRPYRIHGHDFTPIPITKGYRTRGIAGWYGWEPESRTSMGTPFRARAFTAASPDLPLPTCVRVTNLSNSRSIDVLVNDRGSFSDHRIMDLSYGAAKALGMIRQGTTPVRVVVLHSTETPPPVTTRPPSSAGLPTAADVSDLPRTFLQSAAFQHVNHAIHERNRLRAAGFHKALIIPGLVYGRRFYKVRIGPLPEGVDPLQAIAEMRKMGFHDFYRIEQ